MARRRTNRRTRRTRRTRYSRRRSRVPVIRRMKRGNKRARFTNRGSLALQSRLQGGASLPMETHARFYWKGSGSVDFGSRNISESKSDQALSLVNIHLPTINTNASGIGYDLTNFRGDFSYKDIWRLLYSECLVLGSKLRYIIRRPLYPKTIARVYGAKSVTDAVCNSQVPHDASAGFWYMRYSYFRAEHTDGSDTHYNQVGYSVVTDDSLLWANMRDFMADASVTWKRDRLPKMTKLSNTFSSNTSMPNHTPLDEQFNPVAYGDSIDQTTLYGEVNAPEVNNPPVSQTYELEFSNRPIYFTANYSLKKHRGTREVNTRGFWQSLDPPSTTPRIPINDDFRVRFGYIAFNSNGTTAFMIPLDRHSNRHVEAEIQYFVRLRTPRVSPWNSVPEIDFGEARAVPDDMAEDSDLDATLDAMLDDNDEDSE